PQADRGHVKARRRRGRRARDREARRPRHRARREAVVRGHIRRRSGDSFELKFDRDRDGGQRRTVYRSFKGTRKQAQAELARLLAQAASGGHTDPSRTTVAEYLRDRLKHWIATGAISPKTAQGYAGLIENQIAPFIGSRPLQKLTTRDVEAWHAKLLTAG